MKKLAILLACLLAFTLAGTSASTYSGYHWGSAKSLSLVDTTTMPQWTQAVDVAVAGWNESPYVKFKVTRKAECGNAKVCVWEFDNPGGPFYAYVVIWLRGGDTIRQAIVYLNDNQIDWTREPEVYQRTLCHELGHVLGLMPDADPDSCMGGSVGHPSARDYEMLAAIYGR